MHGYIGCSDALHGRLVTPSRLPSVNLFSQTMKIKTLSHPERGGEDVLPREGASLRSLTRLSSRRSKSGELTTLRSHGDCKSLILLLLPAFAYCLSDTWRRRSGLIIVCLALLRAFYPLSLALPMSGLNHVRSAPAVSAASNPGFVGLEGFF